MGKTGDVRRLLPLLAGLLLLPLLWQFPSNSHADNEIARLNVLLVTIDTLRPDRLGCYGSSIVGTPNIDGLAAEGIVFSRAFAHAPMTLPSHANILLGSTPPFHGVHDNNNFVVRDEYSTLAEYLKEYGYATGAFVGAYPLDSRFGLDQGFDVYNDDYERSHRQKITTAERRAEEVVDQAIGWLKARSSPWFLWLHCYDPHDPYDPPEPYKSRFGKNPYDGEVAYVDGALGRLLGFMGESPASGRTLIIFTGDHGESLGQHEEETHGFTAYSSALWVPLIVSFPGSTAARVPQYVSHIDIFPTVCDILRLEKPASLQGRSLLPLIKGGRLPQKPVYFEALYPYYSRGWAPIRGFIGRKKFIDSPLPEVYDMDSDFDELRNLARTEKLDRYRAELERIIEALSSPGAARAEERLDRASLEKLRSLGYISSGPIAKKEEFGPEDDVKTLLPFNNRAVEAMELAKKGKTREGIEMLKKVIEEARTLDSAYYNLAVLYETQDRIPEALETLRSGMEAIPSSYELFFNYTGLSLKAGLFDEVIRAVKESGFPQAESDPELLNDLGVAYSRTGDLDKAIAIYNQALALDGKYPALYNNLGTAYLALASRKKDSRALGRSLESFKKAIDVDPQYPLPHNGLGMAYRQAGNLEAAIFCWEKALGLDPDFRPVLYNLGRAYMDRADFRRALSYFEKYRQKYAGSLGPEEKEGLDSLIKACEAKIGG